MANKGKNTNSSQFFILYRPAKHLDRKHTIFGRVVGGLDVLTKLENVPVGAGDRPIDAIIIEDIVVFVDPFEEFQKQKRERDEVEKVKEEIKKQGGTEDDKTTWTGKRVRGDGTVIQTEQGGSVGKYLKAATNGPAATAIDEAVNKWQDDPSEEPVKKKIKAGGFGNFDSW
jgi:peptidyl-prolyl cis-trans isomerase-like protein 2